MSVKKELDIVNYEDIWCVDENNYKSEMEKEVEVKLEQVKVSGLLNTEEGKYIYYEMYKNENPVGNILISHGFTENAEKFKEMIYYFFNGGYSVFIMDHRGHGRSWRLHSNCSLTHIESFDEYVEDMKKMVEKIVKVNSQKKPVYLYAHSMGGAIGVLYSQKYPKDFKKLVLSSPMLGIDFGAYPAWLGGFLAKGGVFLGKANEKMFVHSEFNPKESFEDSSATSKARFKYYFEKRLKNENFQNYAGTYRWLEQAIKALKEIFRTENLEKLKQPILVFQAEKDTTVRAKEQDEFVKRVTTAEMLLVKSSKHEIYMSPNSILNPYLKAIFEFLKD